MKSGGLLRVFAQLVLGACIFLQVIHACSEPNPPEHMVLDSLNSGKPSTAGLYKHNETAFFHCKDGFVMKGSWRTLAKKCKKHGRWVWKHKSTKHRAYCIKSSDVGSNDNFTCDNGQKIARSKRCDCNPDCSDGSDEGYRANCGPYIMVNVTGKRYGTLKSPGYPHGYPGQLSCTYKIFTSDPNSHISLDFDTFDLRPSTSAKDPFTKLPTEYCKDYIKLSNNKYSSIYKVQCSGIFNYGSCSAWCGGSSPPESRSMSNYILLQFHTSTSTRKYKGFSAFWTNEGYIPPTRKGDGNERPTDVFAHTDVDEKHVRNDDDDDDDDENAPDHGSHSDSANKEGNNLTAEGTIGIVVAVLAVVAITVLYVYWRSRRLSAVHHVPLHNVILISQE